MGTNGLLRISRETRRLLWIMWRPSRLFIFTILWIRRCRSRARSTPSPLVRIGDALGRSCTYSCLFLTRLVCVLSLTDNCKKTGILLESVVASVEVVNSKSLQVQVTGKAPTVSVDKTDGFHLFLSKDSLDTELLTSKSSEVNISWPQGEDWEEKAVPEQMITKIKDGKVGSEIVQHKG